MVNIDYLLLTVFAVQHRVMARRSFKERWPQIVPWGIERSTFVLLASLALLLLFWQWRPIAIEIRTIQSPASQGREWSLFAMGWITVLIVTVLINHFDLFGLRRVWLPLVGKPYERPAASENAHVAASVWTALWRFGYLVLAGGTSLNGRFV